MSWIGIDFDATLAEWGEGTSNPRDVLRVGDPIPKMVERVKQLIAEGQEIRIFTARVGPATDEECRNAFAGRGKYPPYAGEVGPLPQRDWDNYQRSLIENFCIAQFGVPLPITCTKDFHMIALYDDRCVQVVSNTGETLEEQHAQQVAQLAEDISKALDGTWDLQP